MLNILMCSNDKCKLKNTCYIYNKAIPDMYQSYGCFIPEKKDNKYSCEYYRKWIKG